MNYRSMPKRSWGRLLGVCLLFGWLLPAGVAVSGADLLVVNGGGSKLHSQVVESLRAALETPGPGALSADPVGLDEWGELAADPQRLAGYRLILSVGTRATDAVLALGTTEVPRMACFLPRGTLLRLLQRHTASAAGVSALVLDQPLARQFSLAEQLLGPGLRIGVMLGAQHMVSAQEIETSAERWGMRMRVLQLGPGERPSGRFRDLLPDLDLILGLPDSQVFNRVSSGWILYASYRARVPVLTYSRGLVQAGALAAVYSTPRQIGEQAAELIRARLANLTAETAQIIYPVAFEFALNRAVARSLAIELPALEQLERILAEATLGDRK